MRFNCGASSNQRESARRARTARLKEWHSWFAWYPVRIGAYDCRWLEWVVRKGRIEGRAKWADWGEYTISVWCWEYRKRAPRA